ncbi:MAG: DUF1015 domain-containing protein [Chloroflexi bacterium HGW-Chloroflexi-4]|nr:MAG: DUF1015 domain-containing protein [Chloroflexi bacterium HGW-Chloroflexi-4]
MKNYPELGVQIPEIQLPVSSIDLQKWSVIACDQYTSQPEYWKGVSDYIGTAPSTLHLVFPEVFLGKGDETARIINIHTNMKQYLEKGLVLPHQGMIYVERTVSGKTRRGLMLALDLEKYDFNAGSTTLIRATEGTILNRLPPRIKIREQAPLEFPHILMLIDDPEDVVIGAIEKQKTALPLAYDFELMQSSGHLTGRFITDSNLENKIIKGLEKLADPKVFSQKYNLPDDTPVLLFASGDGNHSLATAKSCWEKLKPLVGMDHPARYALVEIENVHDQALEFEPIHRVIFGLKTDIIQAMKEHFGSDFSFVEANDYQSMIASVKSSSGPDHHFGFIDAKGSKIISIKHAKLNLPVGTLQEFLDSWMKKGQAAEIDYVHGDEAVLSLSTQTSNAGFYLAGMPKSDLFKTVIMDGSLPRKTFSMGEAHEKRFYFEARSIS